MFSDALRNCLQTAQQRPWPGKTSPIVNLSKMRPKCEIHFLSASCHLPHDNTQRLAAYFLT